MTQFEAGDKVQLKSGGPVMTVESTEENTVNCIWFEGKSGNKSVVRNSFPAVVLEKYKPSAGFVVV